MIPKNHVLALHGLEAARATLGHAGPGATQIYAEKSAHLAIEIAPKNKRGVVRQALACSDQSKLTEKHF